MPVEQHEQAERTNRPSDGHNAYASIAANCWNQIQTLNTKQDSSLPATFGNFELIAQAPALEATIPTLAIPKLDMQPAATLSDIPKDANDYRQQARQYFAEQALKCQLLSDEHNTIAWDKHGNEKPKIDPKFKDKGDAEEGVDHETARRQSQVLTHLAAYSERHEGIGPKLIAAIIRNEHSYYGPDDVAEDAIASRTGNALGRVRNISIGPGQVSLSNIQALQHKYPQLFGDMNTSDTARAATGKTFSTALVAAYLDDRAKTLESWAKNPPDRSKLTKDEKLLYDYSLPLWKSGQETKALISSFNPGDGSSHIKNVLRQMELIDAGK